MGRIFEVTIKGSVIKTYEVEAEDQESAEELAHEMFTVGPETGVSDDYYQDTVEVELVGLAEDEASTEKLAELARDEDSEVRRAVADNRSTPVELLTQLAQDAAYGVCYAVARNPNTPAEALTKLARDENWDVRYCVAKHPNTPAEVLAELAKDEDEAVRRAVARNPNTPKPEEEGIRI
jgi:hypothetical protein